MIALFIIMGLALLGGGLATLVDGLPYLVLERGFTQVLGGVTAATGGVILLALAWVLVEIRRVQAALRAAPATAPRPSLEPEPSPASEPAPTATPIVDRAQAELDLRGTEPRLVSDPAPVALGSGIGMGTGIGLAAGGAAMAAVSQEPALTAADDGETPAEDSGSGDETSAGEEGPVQEPETLAAERTESQPEPEDENEPEPEPGPVSDFAPADGWAPASWPEAAAPSRASDPFAEAIAAAMQPHDYEAPGQTAEASPVGRARETDSAESEPTDGIDLLRESFARPDASLDPVAQHEGEEQEPADAWMLAVRREDSWLSSLSPAQDDEATQPAAAAADSQAEAASANEPLESLPLSEPEDHEPEFREPAAVPEPAQPEAPASSDEGIIGAYQVGDAHFTIYADGSIKARTPDGNYDFDSMDELKAYLASEKSRLGL